MTHVTANCLSWQCDLSTNYFALIIRKKVKIVTLRNLLLLPSNMLLRMERKWIYSQKATEWTP